MEVLVLCKRQYTGKDLLDDRYGRLFELPAALVERGHHVTGATWSYRRRHESSLVAEGVRWWSVDAWPSPTTYWRKLRSIVASRPPDVLWASSDVLHAVFGARLAQQFDLPLVIDLYDDYESFGLSRLPGVRWLLRRACAGADALTVVSQTLSATIRERIPSAPPIEVIRNGVAKVFCNPLSRKEARLRLGLPLDVPLVGTAGALDGTRGTIDLVRAFHLLRESRTDVRLVVAGPRDAAIAREFSPDVIDLGIIPHAQVSWLYSALDVGVVCNRDSAFSRACHPLKLVEMLACKLPVVAAAVGDTALILGSQPQCLFFPGDHRMLAERIERQLVSPIFPEARAARWSELAQDLEEVLQAAIEINKKKGGASISRDRL